MLSDELKASVQDVALLLFKAPVRGFVPKINWSEFVAEDSVPMGIRIWLESSQGTAQNAIVQLLILNQDPLAHTRGEEPHPFIISKDLRTDGWQTASAVALEAGIATQWPTSLEGITDISKRPRLQTIVNSICDQIIPGTKLSVLMGAIQLCLKSLSVAATTDDVVEALKDICARASFLNLDKATQRAMEGVCIGLADLYADKLELGEARFEIANDLDKSGRYSEKAIQAPLFQTDNHMTAASIAQAKALVHEKMHADIERHRVQIQSTEPSTDERDYLNALTTAMHRLQTPSSILNAFRQGR